MKKSKLWIPKREMNLNYRTTNTMIMFNIEILCYTYISNFLVHIVLILNMLIKSCHDLN